MSTPAPLSADQVLAALPRARFTAEAVADLTATTPAEAARALTALVQADRATHSEPGRFTRTGPAGDETADPAQGLERVLDYFLERAAACCQATNPWRWYLGPAFDTLEQSSAAPTVQEARAWMGAQFQTLAVAVEDAHTHQLHSRCWQLVETLKSELTRARHPQQRARLCALGLASARACQDGAAQAMLELMCAQAALADGHTEQALEHTDHAYVLAEPDHPHIAASVWEAIGLAHHQAGRWPAAEDAHRRSVTAHEELGDERGAALMRRNLGRTLAAAGDHAGALDCYDQAQPVLEQCGDTYLLARLHTLRSQALLGLGRARAQEATSLALVEAQEGLRLGAPTGSEHLTGHAYTALADCLEHTHPTAQRMLLERALDLYTDVQAPEAAEVTARLRALDQTPKPTPST
jgi:tetratricopeptide (TPR) repeat protein